MVDGCSQTGPLASAEDHTMKQMHTEINQIREQYNHKLKEVLSSQDKASYN